MTGGLHSSYGPAHFCHSAGEKNEEETDGSRRRWEGEDGQPSGPRLLATSHPWLWQPSLPRAPLPALMQRCVGAAGSYGDGGLSQLDLRPLASFILETNATGHFSSHFYLLGCRATCDKILLSVMIPKAPG